MKAQCQTRELLEAVNLVSGVVSSHSTRPILQSVHIEALESEGLVIKGTDMEVGLSISVDEVHVEEPGTVVVSANRLHAILREARDEQTHLDAASEDGYLKVNSGNSKFRVATGSVDEFPELEFRPPSPALQSGRESFLQMLQRASVAAAKDATRFQMHSVLIDVSDGNLRLVSTDGKRMALCQEPIPEQAGDGIADGQYIVPLKGIELLMRVLSIEEGDAVEIHLDESEITYSSDRISLSCRLVEGRYPEYQRAIPAGGEHCYDLNAEEMLVALRQAAIMTTKETNSVQFTFHGDRLVISAQANNIGESRIEMEVTPVEGGDGEFIVSFNPGYLLDLFKSANTPVLRGRFKDRKTAGLFHLTDDDASYRHVVMPLVATE